GPNETAPAAVPVRPAKVEYETKYFRRVERHDVTIDPDLAWLCGYFLGDGSLGRVRIATRNKQGRLYKYAGLRLRFHDETVEVLERVQTIVARVFGERASIQQDGRGSHGKHLGYTGRRVTAFFAILFEPVVKTYTYLWPSFV